MFLRSSKVGGKVYWRVVESFREGGKPKHRTVYNLGPCESREEANARWEAIEMDELRSRAQAKAEPTPDDLRSAAAAFGAFGGKPAGDDPFDIGDWLKARYADFEAGVDRRDGLDDTIKAHWDAIDDFAGRPRRSEQRQRTARPRGKVTHDWHVVLGVDRSASMEAIRSAYRRKAVELHPDRGGSAEAMAALNAAYDSAKTVRGA